MQTGSSNQSISTPKVDHTESSVEAKSGSTIQDAKSNDSNQDKTLWVEQEEMSQTNPQNSNNQLESKSGASQTTSKATIIKNQEIAQVQKEIPEAATSSDTKKSSVNTQKNPLAQIPTTLASNQRSNSSSVVKDAVQPPPQLTNIKGLSNQKDGIPTTTQNASQSSSHNQNQSTQQKQPINDKTLTSSNQTNKNGSLQSTTTSTSTSTTNKTNIISLAGIAKQTQQTKRTNSTVNVSSSNRNSNFSSKNNSLIAPASLLVNPSASRYTFALGRGNYPNLVGDALKARGNWTQIQEDQAIATAHLYWKQLPFNFMQYDQLDERLEADDTKPFWLNHFEVTKGIGTKTGLIRSLQKYYDNNDKAKAAGYTIFDTTPTTFVIARSSDDHEINFFMRRYREISTGGSRHERVPLKHCEQNMWVVKPASLNQGKGIEIFRTMRDISEFIFQKNPSIQFWVIQKYIERPFLFKQRKFDLRIWTVVTEDFRIYVYKEGYLRTSSSEYNLKDRNTFVHLTNQCLQNQGENYAQFEEGNTLSFMDLQGYLDEEFGEYDLNVHEMLMPRIKDIIIDTFLSVRNVMNQNGRKNVFELFGFDFLLDEDFRTWLIEVNVNPFLGAPSNYMKRLVPNMINDMLKVCIDPKMKPKNEVDPERDNNFELIYQEASAKNGQTGINLRRPFDLDICYPIPKLKPFIGKKKNFDEKRVMRQQTNFNNNQSRKGKDIQASSLTTQTATTSAVQSPSKAGQIMAVVEGLNTSRESKYASNANKGYNSSQNVTRSQSLGPEKVGPLNVGRRAGRTSNGLYSTTAHHQHHHERTKSVSGRHSTLNSNSSQPQPQPAASNSSFTHNQTHSDRKQQISIQHQKSGSKMKKHKTSKKQRLLSSSEGIAELVDEEEKSDEVDQDQDQDVEMIIECEDEETKEIMQTLRTQQQNQQQQRKNLLCKTLLDQTKELCYSHSPVYKDFDIMFQKVFSRLVHWEMYEDEEIAQAGKSLKVMANSGQIVNLVLEKHLKRIFEVYKSDEVPLNAKIPISETFLLIAKNIGLRKIFLANHILPILAQQALSIIEDAQKGKTSKNVDVNLNAVRVLCLVCTIKKNKFYIPGETNLAERLRKRAFDTGIFTLLTHLYQQTKESPIDLFKEIGQHVRETVLNWMDLQDMNYHVRFLQTLIEKPPHIMDCSGNSTITHQSPPMLTEKSSASSTMQTMTGGRGVSYPPTSPQSSSTISPSLSLSTTHQQLNEQNKMMVTPKQNSEKATGLTTPTTQMQQNSPSKFIQDQSSSKVFQKGSNNGSFAPFQSTNNSSIATTTYSTTQQQNQSHHSQSAQVNSESQQFTHQQQQRSQHHPLQLNTEKILQSSDKISVTELWRSDPQPSISQALHDALDNLKTFLVQDVQVKTERLKERLDKRKVEEKKKEQAKKMEEARKEQELARKRKERIDQVERKKEQQRKFAEELKRRAEVKQQIQAAAIEEQRAAKMSIRKSLLNSNNNSSSTANRDSINQTHHQPQVQLQSMAGGVGNGVGAGGGSSQLQHPQQHIQSQNGTGGRQTTTTNTTTTTTTLPQVVQVVNTTQLIGGGGMSTNPQNPTLKQLVKQTMHNAQNNGNSAHNSGHNQVASTQIQQHNLPVNSFTTPQVTNQKSVKAAYSQLPLINSPQIQSKSAKQQSMLKESRFGGQLLSTIPAKIVGDYAQQHSLNSKDHHVQRKGDNIQMNEKQGSQIAGGTQSIQAAGSTAGTGSSTGQVKNILQPIQQQLVEAERNLPFTLRPTKDCSENEKTNQRRKSRTTHHQNNGNGNPYLESIHNDYLNGPAKRLIEKTLIQQQQQESALSNKHGKNSCATGSQQLKQQMAGGGSTSHGQQVNSTGAGAGSASGMNKGGKNTSSSKVLTHSKSLISSAKTTTPQLNKGATFERQIKAGSGVGFGGGGASSVAASIKDDALQNRHVPRLMEVVRNDRNPRFLN